MENDEKKMKKYRIIAGIIVIGSIWGMLECTIGGMNTSIGALYLPMGAVMAGLFGIGFMALGRRLFAQKGMALGIALVAGILRFFAPVGSCILCSSIAIMAEGVIFELVMSRPIFSLNSLNAKDPRTWAYLGIITGYAIYVSGYIITQVLTPIIAHDGGHILDVVGILPLILGRGFFAAILGGVSLPLVVLSEHLSIDVVKVRKELYYTASTLATTFCWAVVLLIYFSGVF
ncbi:MAG: hypothetical protein KAU14_04710 [Thermoplasmata archaeon]|nr:hypothetical protein [Thermoplasmata archaeon]